MYNFDEIIDREGTCAESVEGYGGYLFAKDAKLPENVDFIRMWVADMDYAVAPEILDAVSKRLDRKILGYTALFGDGFYNAFSGWCKEMYGWSFDKKELTTSPGIVPALYSLVGLLAGEGEEALIMTPSYGCFKYAADYNGCQTVTSELINKDGYYSIDFDDFEKKASGENVRLVIFCNPHNPSGRVWTEAELTRFAGIIEKNNLWVISDEIHCDLLRTGKRHIPLGKVMPDYKRLVTCMSASKTFNLAGMMYSSIIIRDDDLRERFISSSVLGGMINPLSLVATQAAYEKGQPWLNELKIYLDGNFKYAGDFFRDNIPGAVCRIPEATYLLWVDIGGLVKTDNLPLYFAQNAGVLLEGGDGMFVGGADGFIRLNLAVPRSVLREGLDRIAKALNKQNEE